MVKEMSSLKIVRYNSQSLNWHFMIGLVRKVLEVAWSFRLHRNG